jgi:hypothetical protein
VSLVVVVGAVRAPCVVALAVSDGAASVALATADGETRVDIVPTATQLTTTPTVDSANNLSWLLRSATPGSYDQRTKSREYYGAMKL